MVIILICLLLRLLLVLLLGLGLGLGFTIDSTPAPGLDWIDCEVNVSGLLGEHRKTDGGINPTTTIKIQNPYGRFHFLGVSGAVAGAFREFLILTFTLVFQSQRPR